MDYTNHLTTFLVPVVHIVDAAQGEYDQLSAELDSIGTELYFFTTANTAIHHARHHARSRSGKLWLVNSQLPEMPGADLVDLLRGIHRQAVLVIVGNQYSKEQEIAALVAGATMYVYKPISFALITELCASLRVVPPAPVPAAEIPAVITFARHECGAGYKEYSEKSNEY